MVLSYNAFLFPCIVIGHFADYGLIWPLWSLRASVHVLLTFRVSIEMSGLILIGLHILLGPFPLQLFFKIDFASESLFVRTA